MKTSSHLYLLADPGEARGSSTNGLVINSLIQSVSLFLPQIYGAAMPKRLEIGLPVINKPAAQACFDKSGQKFGLLSRQGDE